MQIRRMISVFGNRENQVLELSPGLNILQASGESGKAAWCAFLLAMLYGADGQEEGGEEGAWSGAAMSGQLDCQAGGRELSILRATRRAGPPLGEFRAILEESGGPAPELTGANCGEKLLGVRREEYVLGALIQGLEEEREPGLGERLAALIPSGDAVSRGPEGPALLEKEQASQRRGTGGRLPALEAELQETTALLATQEALSSRLEGQGSQRSELAERSAALEAELEGLERWEAHWQQRACRQAEAEAEEAEAHALHIRGRLERQGVPETETVTRLRGAIVNLNTTRKSGEQACAQRDQAAEALLEAETRLNENPFAGMKREEAEALPLHLRPRPRFPRWGLPVLFALGLVLGILLYLIKKSVPLSLGAGCLLAGAAGAVLVLSTRRKQVHWEEQAEEKRKRREADLAEWEVLQKAAEAARAEHTAKKASWDELQTAILITEQGILEEIQRFAPGAVDIPAADAALRAAAILRKELAEAEAAARKARHRCGQMPLPEGAPSGEETPPAAPIRSRDEIQRELQQARTALESLRSEGERLSGRLKAIGNPAALHARAEALADQIASFEKEYAALTEALSELERVSESLQGLSPALGLRTAEIYSELAGDFLLPPEQARGETAKQLYLALRLAVCQLVLPAEEPVPIILDGALTGLEGANCEAALRWIRRAAEERQILLFTCRGTEAAFFQDDPAVAIHPLAAMHARPPQG